MNTTELLAPAGSFASLKAALAAGADAVYTGGQLFGARAYAENLSGEELTEAIDLVHLAGKKLYLTVNTLLKEKELQDKIDAIREELTEEQCEDLVMQLLHDGFVEELDAYLSAEVQKTIRAVNKLWEKYHVSVTTLLDERKAAEDKLNGFLAQLGYIPKKEVDA